MRSKLQELESAVRLAVADARYRHFIKKDYIAGTDCDEDDAFLAFADQAVAEAEMRETQARFTLKEHMALCRSRSIADSN